MYVDKDCIRLIVAGSRGFEDYEKAEAHINAEFENAPPCGIGEIVSGGAYGADKMGEKYATEYNIPLKQFLPDWDHYGKGAGLVRNKQMAEYADCAIIFWDGRSRGTQSLMGHLSRMGKWFIVIGVGNG